MKMGLCGLTEIICNKESMLLRKIVHKMSSAKTLLRQIFYVIAFQSHGAIMVTFYLLQRNFDGLILASPIIQNFWRQTFFLLFSIKECQNFT